MKDKQDEKPWSYCVVTGSEIYSGESYLESPEGEVIIDEFSALLEHTSYQRRIAGEGEN